MDWYITRHAIRRFALRVLGTDTTDERAIEERILSDVRGVTLCTRANWIEDGWKLHIWVNGVEYVTAEKTEGVLKTRTVLTCYRTREREIKRLLEADDEGSDLGHRNRPARRERRPSTRELAYGEYS